MSLVVLSTTLHTGVQTAFGSGFHVRAVMAAIRAQGGTGADASVRGVAAVAGYVSYGLMWLTLVWGIVTTTGWAVKFIRRSTVYGGHMMPRLGITITIAEGSVAKRQLVATYTNGAGRLVGAVAINAPRALIPNADRVTALPNRRTSDRVISGSARP